MTKSKLFQVIVHEFDPLPGVTGVCAGYETGEWRAKALADHLMESLPEFCLTHSEIVSFTHANAVELLRHAARRIYQTDKFTRRGEFGELLLHVILRELFDTVPAISKIYYKDSANDTVKGFDAVHVINAPTSLELWLGEVKFYADLKRAISDVVDELRKHTDSDYLRSEFIAIKNKIDGDWPHADRLKRLLDPKVSLDDVFDRVCIPVLLTYDGSATGKYDCHCDEYVEELKAEFEDAYEEFVLSDLPINLKIHLILVPPATKAKLITLLDGKLRAWQSI